MNDAKICILTSVHPPFDPRIFYKQAKSLSKKGYDVTLIAQHQKKEIVDGIKIIPLQEPDNRLTRILLTSFNLFRKALKVDADIYHFHDPELIPIGILLKLKGKKVIYDVHEDYVTGIRQKSYLPIIFRKMLSYIVCGIEKVSSKFFSVILAERYYEYRFPNGIKILNYPLKSKLKAIKKKEKKSKTSNLLYTGNITENRGALIHAKLLNKMENIKLYMIGQCNINLANNIKNIVTSEKNRLYLRGEGEYVPYSEILNYYKNKEWLAGLALFPSNPFMKEKELTKFFEYMAAGIPIICSNFPVWKQLIEDTGAGITVDPTNLNEVCEAIRFLKRNPDKAFEMGQNGKKAVKKIYNWSNEEKKLLNLYERLLN